MASKLVLTGLCTLAVRSLGNECKSGFVHKQDLTGLRCMGKTEDAASCNSECCEVHKGTCGGIGKVKCTWDQYQPQDATSLNTLASEKSKNEICCRPRATCAQAKCKAGWKMKTANSAVLCPGGPETCTESEGACCEPDKLTCGGLADCTNALCGSAASTCPVGSVIKNKKDATWRAKEANTVTFPTNCCTTAAKCDKATCPNGQSLKLNAGTITCKDASNQESANVEDCNRDALTAKKSLDITDWSKGLKDASVKTQLQNKIVADAYLKIKADHRIAPSLAASSTAVQTFVTALETALDVAVNPCCQADITKCGGNANSCTAGYTPSGYGPSWAATGTTAGAGTGNPAQYTKDCCSQVATCASATCPAGYKKRVNSAKVACSGSSITCSLSCCIADTKKCSGYMGSIACPYGTFYEPAFWIAPGGAAASTPQAEVEAWMNRPANATNKNTNCCTARVACAIGTTTPNPTATPAVPALKYSAHTKAINKEEKKSEHIFWMAIGAMAGMGVFMQAQNLRSKRRAIPTENESDSEGTLLDEMH